MSNFLELARWLRDRDLEHIAILAKRHHDITNIDALRSLALGSDIQGATVADMSKLREALKLGRRLAEATPSTVQKRKDAPTIKPAGRGQLHLAINAGRPENREQARQAMLNDIFAQSSSGPRESKWTTWCTIADAFLGWKSTR